MMHLTHKNTYLSRVKALLVAGSLLALTAACSGTTEEDPKTDAGTGGGVYNPIGTLDCPTGKNNSLSVCEVQKDATLVSADVTLRDVIATSDVFKVSDNLMGFTVSDSPIAPFGGALVVFFKDAGFTIKIGQHLDITGYVESKASKEGTAEETRIKIGDEGTVIVNSEGDALAPIEVTDFDALMTADYEGVLVHVPAGVVSSSVSHHKFDLMIGDKTILIGAEAGYEHFAVKGQKINSLTGVIRLDWYEGRYKLCPRSEADVDADEIAFEKRTIGELRDPENEKFTGVCAYNDNSCKNYILENLVVVSPTIATDFDNESGKPYRFGFYVVDSSMLDADDKAMPYSASYVSITPNSKSIQENDYSFSIDANGNYGLPTIAAEMANFPQVGDVLTINAQYKENYDFSQLKSFRSLKKVGTVATMDSIKMPKPREISGDELADLKGGRPEYSADYGSLASDAIAASANIEKWEGAYVKVINVSMTNACYGVPNKADKPENAYNQDRGNSLITGDIELGDQFDAWFETPFAGYWPDSVESKDQTCENLAAKCGDSRAVGKQFTSITGFINYNYKVWRLNPTKNADFEGTDLFVADSCTDSN